MKTAGWRTTTAYHLRALGRQLIVAWGELLDRVEDWRERHIVAEDPYDRALEEAASTAAAVAWVGSNRPRCPGGRADVWVKDVGPGRESAMVEAYLGELAHPAPREVIG